MPRKKKAAAPAPGRAHDQAVDNAAGQAAQPLDKAGAVREALAAGIRSRQDILAHVRRKYGMEVSPNYVSRVTSKSKRGKAGKKPTPAAPQGTAAQPAARAPARNGGGLTPQDLVALAELAAKAGGVKRLRDFLEALKRVR